MPGRIGRAFEVAKREKRGAFIPYLTSGYPDLAESDRLAFAICEGGADLLELGVPFSDPLADGPTIQKATQIALGAGTTLAHVLGQALRIRARHQTPIVLMTYMNPVIRFGPARFAEEARGAGVDGVILVDLPPEEDPAFWETMRRSELDTIALVAPTTLPDRLERIVGQARGFLYVVARMGVTGGGAADPTIVETMRRCRALTTLPRCVGFGIGKGSDLSPWRGLAEGVIVGSALLDELMRASDAKARESLARDFTRAFRAKLSDLAPA